MKLMYLKFLDHCSEAQDSWKAIEDMDYDVPSIEVVGFLAKEDEHSYYLVQAHGDKEYRNSFSVLKSTVVKKKVFKDIK